MGEEIDDNSRDPKDPKAHFPDLTHLIRSIQHLEGNPQCFGRAAGNCDRSKCAWREFCLKEE
jgi:hypothetical protein